MGPSGRGEIMAVESVNPQNSEGVRSRSGVVTRRETDPHLASNLLIGERTRSGGSHDSFAPRQDRLLRLPTPFSATLAGCSSNSTVPAPDTTARDTSVAPDANDPTDTTPVPVGIADAACSLGTVTAMFSIQRIAEAPCRILRVLFI